jgi:hypothetical protein
LIDEAPGAPRSLTIDELVARVSRLDLKRDEAARLSAKTVTASSPARTKICAAPNSEARLARSKACNILLAPRPEICISARSAKSYRAGFALRPTWTTSRFGRFGNDEAGFGQPQI